VETKVFKYRQKLFPKLALAVIFASVPSIFRSPELYSSIGYWLIFLALQGLVHAYFASKRVIVSESGIETRLLGMRLALVPWRQVEELSIIAPPTGEGVGQGGLMQALEPFAVIRWFANKGTGNKIKVVVTGWDPLVFLSGEIKNGSELAALLRSRIPLV
jgi:hypothetical protein